MHEPLKNCPFCGGDARHDAHADDCYFILHRKMKGSGADMSPAFEVLEAWNRRASLSLPAAGQEPVAWRTFDGEGGYDYRTYDGNENYRAEWEKRNPNHKGWVEPLYAPQPAPVREPAATDTARLDYMQAHPEKFIRYRKGKWTFLGFTNYEFDMHQTLREAIDASAREPAK